MNRLLLSVIILLFTISNFKAQNLSEKETLDYIFTKCNYQITTDTEGNLNIDDKALFNYSNIVLVRKGNTELEFRCKINTGNCIKLKDFDRQVYSYKIKLASIVFDNVYNAFDYLFFILNREKPKVNKDPFSSHNYKKQ